MCSRALWRLRCMKMSLRCIGRVFGRFREVRNCPYCCSYVSFCREKSMVIWSHPIYPLSLWHSFTSPAFPPTVAALPSTPVGKSHTSIALRTRVVRSCPAMSHDLGCVGPEQASSHIYTRSEHMYCIYCGVLMCNTRRYPLAV
jgi:hypothetical protein